MVGFGLLQQDADRRLGFGEGGQQAVQQPAERRGRGCQAHHAFGMRQARLHRLHAVGQRGQDAADQRHQVRRHLGGRGAAGVAVEELGPEQALEVGHDVRHRRLRQAHRLGRALEAAELGHGHQHLQMPQPRARQQAVEQHGGGRAHVSTLLIEQVSF